MSPIRFVALTGGPGGGKTTLIQELRQDPFWREHILALPEAISVVGQIGVSIRTPLFQKLMVNAQFALEDVLSNALDQETDYLVLCHRGSLDPLAYWLDRGWQEDEFFAYTGTTREKHYNRYAAVIHFVTTAEGALGYYRRYPEAHRPELPEEAVRLDQLLRSVWSPHPQFQYLANKGSDWADKKNYAIEILKDLLR